MSVRRLIVPPEQRGAALLTVLLLVSVIAVIAATSLDRLRLSTRLAGNAAAMAQADAFLESAEHVALTQISGLKAQHPGGLPPGVLGEPRLIPVTGGLIDVRLSDGGNCFNLNGLVRQAGNSGRLSADRDALAVFVNLMQLVGVPAGQAGQIAASAADWIDSDGDALPGGAEDAAYRGRAPAYLPPNAMMAHESELRAVAGMDADAWQRLQPWVCALPDAGSSAVNVNSLIPDQAVLLSMLDPAELPPGAAKSLLANRPANGYGSLVRFWAMPALSGLKDRQEIVARTTVASRWFRLEARVEYGGIMAGERALIDAGGLRPHLVWRQGLID